MTVPAPANPFAIEILDLSRRAGSQREFTRSVALTERVGNEVIGIAAGDAIELAGRLESLHDGILVSATVEAPLTGECVRCLIPITERANVEIQELFAYDSSDEAFDYSVQGDKIDLEQAVVDALVPALPFQPVCDPECEGLCAECGVRLSDNPGHEHDAAVDPRWAALTALAEQNETNDGAATGAADEGR